MQRHFVLYEFNLDLLNFVVMHGLFIRVIICFIFYIFSVRSRAAFLKQKDYFEYKNRMYNSIDLDLLWKQTGYIPFVYFR